MKKGLIIIGSILLVIGLIYLLYPYCHSRFQMYLYFTYREEKVNTVRELSIFNSVSQIDLFK